MMQKQDDERKQMAQGDRASAQQWNPSNAMMGAHGMGGGGGGLSSMIQGGGQGGGQGDRPASVPAQPAGLGGLVDMAKQGVAKQNQGSGFNDFINMFRSQGNQLPGSYHSGW